jgi:hypothetical protein
MRLRAWGMIGIAMIIVFSFQNCTRTGQNVRFDASSKLTLASADNGHPYDGKILVLTGAPCSDGSEIHSKIVMKTATSGDLVRDNCTDITPVSLTNADFQIDPNNQNELIYQNQVFGIIGTPMNMAALQLEIGYSFIVYGNYGTQPDNTNFPSVSKLQLYEDGRPLGPGHSIHQDIQMLGLGRFSHWANVDGSFESVRFSTSDNSDPRANSRTYTYTIF